MLIYKKQEFGKPTYINSSKLVEIESTKRGEGTGGVEEGGMKEE